MTRVALYQTDDLESLQDSDINSHFPGQDQAVLQCSNFSFKHLSLLSVLVIALFVSLLSKNKVSDPLTNFLSGLVYPQETSTSYSISINVYNEDYGTLSSLSYLPWDAVAEPHRENIFSLSSFVVDGVNMTSYLNDSSMYMITWTFNGESFSGQNIAYEVGSVGIYEGTVAVTALTSSAKMLFLDGTSRFSPKMKLSRKNSDQSGKYSSAYEMTFLLAVKYIRREIRTLTDSDKSKVLTSMALLYNLNSLEGQTIYGDKFQSAEYFSAKHLLGGGRTDCDYWHDGSAVAVTHLAFTLEYEQALQSIEPSVAMPYWEYANDKYLYSDASKSVVFDSDWFGGMVGNGPNHAINDGSTWCDAKTASGDNYLQWSIADSGSMNPYVNAYNNLRSPWNNNPSPRISRWNQTYGVVPFGNFPSCDSYHSTILSEDLSTVNSYLNGNTHGPVHILIGGAWDTISNSTYSYLEAPSRLLFFKILWRQGLTRCPTSCSLGVSCRCSVPTDYINEYGSFYILEKANVITVLQANGYIGSLSEYDDAYWNGLLDVVEHPGVAGDMYSSSAAFDPLFWPIHGTMDRLLALKRILYEEGLTTFNETWGFPYTNTSLDIFLKGRCDWSDVTSVTDLTLPTCDTSAECPGHVESYTSLFSNFLGEGETYTNGELYDFFHPWADDLPYTYDDFTFSVCSDNGEDVLSGINVTDTLVFSGYGKDKSRNR